MKARLLACAAALMVLPGCQVLDFSYYSNATARALQAEGRDDMVAALGYRAEALAHARAMGEREKLTDALVTYLDTVFVIAPSAEVLPQVEEVLALWNSGGVVLPETRVRVLLYRLLLSPGRESETLRAHAQAYLAAADEAYEEGSGERVLADFYAGRALASAGLLADGEPLLASAASKAEAQGEGLVPLRLLALKALIAVRRGLLHLTAMRQDLAALEAMVAANESPDELVDLSKIQFEIANQDQDLTRAEAALESHRRALEGLPEQDPRRQRGPTSLEADLAEMRGDYDRVVALRRQLVEAHAEAPPAERVWPLLDLADALLDTGPVDEAASRILEARGLVEAQGDGAAGVALIDYRPLNGLGTIALRVGELDLAEGLLRKVHGLLEPMGEAVASGGSTASSLAETLSRKGENEEALGLMKASWSTYNQAFGKGSLQVAILGMRAAVLRARAGHGAKALRQARQAWQVLDAKLPASDGLSRALGLARLARCELLAGQPADALAHVEQAQAAADPIQDATHPDRARRAALRAEVLDALGRGAEAAAQRAEADKIRASLKLDTSGWKARFGL